MASKVYGIIGTNKAMKEVIPKDGLKGMLPARYEFMVMTDAAGNFDYNLAAASPEITSDSVILAVNFYDMKTHIKELAPSNINATLDVNNCKIRLKGKGLVKDTKYWFTVVVVEIPKLGQSD